MRPIPDRKSTRLNSSHVKISYAVFCLKKKKYKGSLRLYKRLKKHTPHLKLCILEYGARAMWLSYSSTTSCLFEVLHFPIFFFFIDTATTDIYTLSLHDALPIRLRTSSRPPCFTRSAASRASSICWAFRPRSEEHTSELQSREHLVCRLLLE